MAKEIKKAADAPNRDQLVKLYAYEFVRFNHDTRQAYLVTDVTDDCMLELEGMAGHFAPECFQLVKKVPAEPTPVSDGRYCTHHDDDPAHTKACYVAPDAATDRSGPDEAITLLRSLIPELCDLCHSESPVVQWGQRKSDTLAFTHWTGFEHRRCGASRVRELLERSQHQ